MTDVRTKERRLEELASELAENVTSQKDLMNSFSTLMSMTLQTIGVKDVFIFCVDGLTGFPEAIEAVYPKSKVQLCIVHMLRNSLKYVSYKDRKEVATDLKNYTLQ